MEHDLDGVKRIWLGQDLAVNATCLFRRTFDLPDTILRQDSVITLFAESNYHLWVNNTYLGRGPAFYHPHRRPAESYPLGRHLLPGRNVVAVLVHSAGVALHNHIPSGTPGLAARIYLPGAKGTVESIVADRSWKATRDTGWQADTPRRSWAVGFIEHFHAAQAPFGWQEIDFDDSGWDLAEERPVFPQGMEGRFIQTGQAPLRFYWQAAMSIVGFHGAPAACHPLHAGDATNDYGKALMDEPWHQPLSCRTDGIVNPALGGLCISVLNDRESAVLCLDMGREYVGAVAFEMKADSSGMLDIGWSETIRAGRPEVLRKGVSYADRYVAGAGLNRWMPVGFSAGRYLLLILRGFNGAVQFYRLGMLVSEPDLEWNGYFRCDQPRLNAIWELCARTVRIGTQEGIMDCPTREQATYSGDAHPTACWLGRLTGNFDYWKHLIIETFAVQSPAGQIKSTVFSGEKIVVLDYSLLAVIGARDYWRETGDRATIRAILPGCRKLLAWYQQRCNNDGLFELPWESLRREGGFVPLPATAWDPLSNHGSDIFIDHPGLGWHNVNEPGIDRRGLNAAMNALLVITQRAAAELMQAMGEDGCQDLLARSDSMAQKAGAVFWNEAESAFADGVLDGRLLPQVSQQTNAWCIMAGFAGRETAKAVLARILRQDDKKLARSGPYFWYYLLPVLMAHKKNAQALAEVERLWSVMPAHDATTAWETFAGDELDSWCHPWSATPVDFLIRHIVGIGSLPLNHDAIVLTPQIQLLRQAEAGANTGRGRAALAWQWHGNTCVLKGSIPSSLTGRLCLPAGKMVPVAGDWSVSFHGQAAPTASAENPHDLE